MGWSIKIGNAVPMSRQQAVNSFDGEGYTQYSFSVESAEHPDAPSWETKPEEGAWDASGKTNSRLPGYSAFADFLEQTGITADDVPAFGARGSDGNCYVLRPEHRDAVSRARAAWEARHPGAVPGWTTGCDMVLARLIWYEWWMTWALEHSERPAIEMS